MNLERFTSKAQEAIVSAGRLATESGHPELTPDHPVTALTGQGEEEVAAVASKWTGVPTEKLLEGKIKEGVIEVDFEKISACGEEFPIGKQMEKLNTSSLSKIFEYAIINFL